KPYRRGLILGLTIAEIMILLIFVLLMALASALARRDARLAMLEGAGLPRLVEELSRAYPEARGADDYFKELVLAIEARKALEESDPEIARSSLLEDATLGSRVRQAADAAGARDPLKFLTDASTSAAERK